MISESIRERNPKKIGYQRIEKLPNSITFNKYNLRGFLHGNMIDMDDPSVDASVKDNVEFIVDTSDSSHHKLEINVKRNETRSQEQKKVREEILAKEKADGTYQNRMDKNVLLLYIDNMSRANFMRRMPKTAQWLARFVDNQESDYTTYQYFRYHSVFYNTQYTTSALYFGEIEDVKDTSNNIFDSYSKNGYITGFFKDACEIKSAHITNPEAKLPEWDHFGGTITCDPNYDNMTFGGVDIFKGKSSVLRHCLYGMDMHNIQIEYLKQFWAAYPDNRKIFRTHFSEAHEVFGDLINYTDEDIRDLLQHFYDMNYLEDTMITIFSDHGAHDLTMRIFLIPDNSRPVENYLPMLFHVVKNDIPDNAKHFLAANEQSFIGSHDVYASIKTIATNTVSRSPNAESYAYIFEAVPEGRDCSDTRVYTKSCWCSKDIDTLNDRMNSKGLFYTNV